MSKNEIQQQLSIREDQPSSWFEPLYSKSSKDGDGVPWANMKVHPSFARWLKENPLDGEGKSALVVGCGMGDDAIELESIGYRVTAFDVSSTAIEYCKQRFPQSKVSFEQADLLGSQPLWHEQFDFVLEIFTVQALPPKYEEESIQNISSFVAPGGTLLVIAEVGREERSFENGPPWLLTPKHVDSFTHHGLDIQKKDFEQDAQENGSATYVTTFARAED